MKLRDLCPWCCAKRPAPESDDEAYGDTASSGGWSSACESEGEPDRNSLDEALLAQEARADRSGVLDASKIELFGKIGEGACGTVRRARVEGRDAAVKCVNFSRHSNPTGMMREVLKEAELHRSVTHERVVALYGVAVCRTQVLIAMELCGDSLHGLLFEARLRLGGGLRGRVMREVAEGMAFLHGRRVLHRDLKPENILVKGFDERAQAASCKLADFGLSTNTSASVAKSNLTLTAMIGTPLYMAPELMVAASRARYGASADVYSYGMVGWSVWARARPFCGAPYRDMAPVAVLNSIKRGSRPKFDHTAPASLRRLVPACWGPRKGRPPFADILAAFFETDLLEREWAAADGERGRLSERAAACI